LYNAWVFLAGMLLTIPGCVAPAPETIGGELYHHNWWNYYTRGVYFLRNNRIAEASADFEVCLGLRPGARFGNARDMWRARTYGLHFVEDYFPNREFGVCLYERQDYEQAIRYLERSLKQEPSGRAKHYLNLALRRQMAGRAVPVPRVRLDGAADAVYTRERALLVSGSAAGEGRIRRLNVCGSSEFIELAEPVRAFSRRIALKPGSNTLAVVAEDLVGQRAEASALRIADWQPPRFTVRRTVPDGRGWIIEGVCRDDYGVVSVRLGGAEIFGAAVDGAPCEVPVSLRLPAAGAPLVATDPAGNRLECPLDSVALDGSPLDAAPAARWRPAAGDTVAAGFGATADLTVLDQMERWMAACRATAREGAFRFAVQTSQGTAGDRLRPSLALRGCQPLTSVFVDEFFVDGTAADGGGLATLEINGENLLAPADEGTVRTYFSRRLSLEPGTNEFVVVASDRAGNRTSRQFTVVRLSPEYLDESFRLSVGVPPLTPADAGLVGARVKRSMEAELTREPVRFKLLERDEGWEFVLREQGLSVSDLADPAAALRISKMLPAEMLLMGKIFNEAKGVTVYLKAVETSNGEVVFASDVYAPDDENALDDAVAGLILKVEQGFPLITGEILRREGARVTLNIGRSDGATENSRFLVIERAGEDVIAEGRLCKADGRPVQLQLEKIQQNTSTARIIPSAADAIVKEGYYVYTR